MEICSPKQSILKNLLELPHPSARVSQILACTRIKASKLLESSMATPNSSGSNRTTLPDSHQSEVNQTNRSVDEAVELLKQVTTKSLSVPLPERLACASIFDDDNNLLITDYHFDIKLVPTLKLLVLHLQSYIEKYCSKTVTKYRNTLLVKEIDIEYFKDKRLGRIPKLSVSPGGNMDGNKEQGTSAEFAQWDQNMEIYWQQFRYVMLVGANTQTLEIPIMRVETIAMTTDLDHGLNISSGGCAFGDRFLHKRFSNNLSMQVEQASTSIEEPNHDVLLLGALNPVQLDNIRSEGKNSQKDELGSSRTLLCDNTAWQSPTMMIKEVDAKDADIDNLAVLVQSNEKVDDEVQQLVTEVLEIFTKLGHTRRIDSGDLRKAFMVAKSIRWGPEWHTDEFPLFPRDSLQIDINDLATTNSYTKMMFGSKQYPMVNTWGFYQRMGGNPFIRSKFNLNHLPFNHSSPVSQNQDVDDLPRADLMAPYEWFDYVFFNPDSIELIRKYQDDMANALGFELEDDDKFIADTFESKPKFAANRTRVRSSNHDEVQAELDKIVENVEARKRSAYLEAFESQVWQSQGNMFTPSGSISATAGIQQANSLSAKSTPFVPQNHNDFAPTSQTRSKDFFHSAVPTWPSLSPTKSPIVRLPTQKRRTPSPAKKNQLQPLQSSQLFNNQEEVDAYHRVAGMDSYLQSSTIARHEYFNAGTASHIQTHGKYDNLASSLKPECAEVNFFERNDTSRTFKNDQMNFSYNNYMNTVSRTQLALHSNDERNVYGAQNFLCSNRSNFTGFDYNNPGNEYCPQYHSNSFSAELLQKHMSDINFNSSIAFAFNGSNQLNAGLADSNLRIPGPQSTRRSRSKTPSRSSRNSSKNRNATSLDTSTRGRKPHVNQTQVSDTHDQNATAGSLSFVPPFRFTAEVYGDDLKSSREPNS